MRGRIFKTFPALKEIFDQTAYEDERSLSFLYFIVKLLKPSVVLELGTGKGCSTAFMALAIEEGIIISIDDYAREDINSIELVKSNLQKCGVLDKVVLLTGSTFETGELVKQYEKPQVVFMDASHIDLNLRREHNSIFPILPEEHLLVVDDALYNDVPNFIRYLVREKGYDFFGTLPFHQGLSIIGRAGSNIDKYRMSLNRAILFQRAFG